MTTHATRRWSWRDGFDFGDEEGFAAPYIPVNGPAISDLLDLFDFDRDRDEERR
jgi:hypothetical protein